MDNNWILYITVAFLRNTTPQGRKHRWNCVWQRKTKARKEVKKDKSFSSHNCQHGLKEEHSSQTLSFCLPSPPFSFSPTLQRTKLIFFYSRDQSPNGTKACMFCSHRFMDIPVCTCQDEWKLVWNWFLRFLSPITSSWLLCIGLYDASLLLTCVYYHVIIWETVAQIERCTLWWYKSCWFSSWSLC